ncbi:hypothetical protein [Bosea sp. (in: a-proteobacteria)]|uniref:hypothetical protein n=1 Tax=Bosea sp. (in: a-proteobacteria) TaxID=1871050 RepID=UPI002735A481|nr:hypothetical protein [Bosea sp. (in: a-proteobacteria)]MDP3407264.1 hypothetical protein [Bosea sp. (in: a-proteobacteria)]
MKRCWIVSFAFGLLASGAPVQSQTPPLQSAVALNVWTAAGAQGAGEPLVSPHQIGKVVRTCSTNATSRCSEERSDLLAVSRALELYPDRMWKIADCLTTGCDGAMPVALGNACVWWTATVDLFPANTTAYSNEMKTFTCGRSRWTAAEQGAIYASWKKAFLAGP